MTFNCSYNPISSVKRILSTTQNVYLFLPCVVKTKRFFKLLCFKSVWSGWNKFASKTFISAFLLNIVCLIAEKEIMARKDCWTNIVEKEIIEVKVIFFIPSLYIQWNLSCEHHRDFWKAFNIERCSHMKDVMYILLQNEVTFQKMSFFTNFKIIRNHFLFCSSSLILLNLNRKTFQQKKTLALLQKVINSCVFFCIEWI
jgi:hypothetical protein